MPNVRKMDTGLAVRDVQRYGTLDFPDAKMRAATLGKGR